MRIFCIPAPTRRLASVVVFLLLSAHPGIADGPLAGSREGGPFPAPEVVKLVTDGATGNPSFIRLTGDLPVPAGADAREKAMALVAEHAAAIGLSDPANELRWVANQADVLGGEQAIFRQVYRGVPVFGTLLRVHFDRDGGVRTVNGTIVSDINLDVVPRVDAPDAEDLATRLVSKTLGIERSALEVRPAKLTIYRENLVRGRPGENHLAWEVEVLSPPELHEALVLDANDGRLIDRRSMIHRLHRVIHLGYQPRPIWTEGDDLPYNSGNTFRDAEINELIEATADAHSLFANLTGGAYLSFDGEDATMNAIYDSDSIECPNAVESGGVTAYCEGMVSDDVAAHEWTHAYTEWTHALVYQWQPGALNEATSDIYGELVDQLNGRGTDSPGGVRPPGNCSVSGGSPQPTLVIDSPPGISGSYAVGGAVFNPTPPWTVSAAVEAVNDGSGVVSDACEPINGFHSGRIALIDRGTCLFRDKVANAQGVGAVGVIMVNNQGDDILEMGGDLPRLDIPSVFLGQSDGELLKANLAAGVTATLDLSGQYSDSVRWLVGEDTEAIGAMRDMWSPGCFGDPDRVSSANYYCGENDNGGVHTNSGVPSHAFALLVDGGNFNGNSVPAIGATKAARIYWRAMSYYQTPVTGFAAHADLLEASCQDLVGAQIFNLTTGAPSTETITAADCAGVAAAMTAVEMREVPDQCDFETLLDPSTPPVSGNLTLLSESFDSDPGPDWVVDNRGVFSEYEPRDWVWTDEVPADGDGGAFFAVDSVLIGDCRPGSDDQSGVMELTSPQVELPLGSSRPVLVFDHWMASEATWDGGNVKLSINDGPFYLVSSSLFLHNPYNARITSSGNSNPLAGEWAWTGTDEGTMSGTWGQSQVDLSSLASAGDRIRFRFDLGVDGCNGAVGWYVDNVRVIVTASSPRHSGRRVAP